MQQTAVAGRGPLGGGGGRGEAAAGRSASQGNLRRRPRAQRPLLDGDSALWRRSRGRQVPGGAGERAGVRGRSRDALLQESSF